MAAMVYNQDLAQFRVMELYLRGSNSIKVIPEYVGNLDKTLAIHENDRHLHVM